MIPAALPPSDPPEIAGRLWAGWTGDLAFDVGAHKGENFGFFRQAGFTRVIALEPEPGSFAELAARGAEPGLSVEFRQAAASDRDGIAVLAAVPGAIAKGELVTPGTDGMEWSPADWASADTLDVSCMTLDTLAAAAGEPDLVVVDTEGHEARVLAGADGILGRAHAGWLVEFHSPPNARDCEDMLAAAGYATEVVRHPHYVPRSGMWHTHGWIRGVPPA